MRGKGGLDGRVRKGCRCVCVFCEAIGGYVRMWIGVGEICMNLWRKMIDRCVCVVRGWLMYMYVRGIGAYMYLRG